jgi:hypothetical protein
VEKIPLVERKKAVERDPACCGEFLYKLFDGDIVFL